MLFRTTFLRFHWTLFKDFTKTFSLQILSWKHFICKSCKTTCKVETPLLSSQFYLEANRFPPEASEIIQIFYKKQKEPNNQNPINKKAFKLAVILIQYKPFSWSFSNHPRIVYEVSSKEWTNNQQPANPIQSTTTTSFLCLELSSSFIVYCCSLLA